MDKIEMFLEDLLLSAEVEVKLNKMSNAELAQIIENYVMPDLYIGSPFFILWQNIVDRFKVVPNLKLKP